MTVALPIAVLMVAAAFGWGALVLRTLGVAGGLERWGWSFPLGMAVIGWVVFPASLVLGVGTPALAAGVVPGLAGLALLPRPRLPDWRGFGPWTWALLAALAILAAGDLAEALAPPADADTMAYHFALPKQFLSTGRIEFTPRAFDGAVPMLIQMTYLAALGLGGETALTLWCGASGWGLALAGYALARRHLGREWALAAALLVQGLPAVLYGGGTGQIETRMAALAMVALAALGRTRVGDDTRLAALAGLAAGFLAAAKYPGLILLGACGLVLLIRRRPFPAVLAYSAAALLAGGQWYLWHWWQTGDPIFPMLYGLVPYRPGTPWSADMVEAVRPLAGMERAVPQSLGWLLLYPLQATFAGLPVFESGRTGLGPLPILLAPFLLAALAALPGRARRSPLAPALVACLIAYAVWFLIGPSQRVRHLLPVAAPALVMMMVAAERTARMWPALRTPLAAGLAVSLLLELGGQAVVSVKAVRHLASGTSREAFLAREISAYPVAALINRTLSPGDKVMLPLRETLYLIDVPVLLSNDMFEGRVETHHRATDPARFWIQMRGQGITHLVLSGMSTADLAAPPATGPGMLSGRLAAAGCLRPVAEVGTPKVLTSRTLGLREAGIRSHLLLALTPESCRF